MTPEGRTKAALKRWLADRGVVYAYWPVPTGYGATTLDCLVCYQGCFWGIECKRQGVEKPTPRQAAVMRQIREAGGQTFLVTLDEDQQLRWLEVKR